MAALSLTGLHKAFAAQPVIHNVTLKIQQGEFVAVLGPSGCGKTTLLRLIAGFETLDRGEIRVDDTVFAARIFTCLRNVAILAWCFKTTRCGRT